MGLPEDKAYIAHHFNCPTCCAAGLSGGKQARCADGLQLWDAYNQAVRLFSHPKQKAPNRRPHYSHAP
ncbi:hypothetical protein APV28_4564 [Comamonas testosteroni]|nr:hypothetical protein APV28_4564 [Comamonas testosteroni]